MKAVLAEVGAALRRKVPWSHRWSMRQRCLACCTSKARWESVSRV